MLLNIYNLLFVFLPITILIYGWLIFTTSQHDFSSGLVAVASLLFYPWLDIIFLPMILSITIFNFMLARYIARISTRKVNEELSPKRYILLALGVIVNIIILVYFRHMDFLISNANLIAGSHRDMIYITLALGISFLVFTQIAYLLESVSEKIEIVVHDKTKNKSMNS